jgi:Tfp pilus assembly protein PilO
MPLNITAVSFPEALFGSLPFMSSNPDIIVVFFQNPDNTFLHAVDAVSLDASADAPLIKPTSIRFVGSYHDLAAILVALLRLPPTTGAAQ